MPCTASQATNAMQHGRAPEPAPPRAITLPEKILRLPSKAVGAAQKLAYSVLWTMAGCRPNTLPEITAGQLASACGAEDPRSARDWLTKLEAAGLVDVAKGKTKGLLSIYVKAPEDVALRLEKGEPPTPLFDHLDAGVCAQKPPEDVSGVCAQKPPATVPFQSPQPGESQQPPAAPPDNAAGVCAQKPPSRPMTHERKIQESSMTHTSIIMGDTGVFARKGPERLSDLAARVEEQTSPQQRLDTWKKRILRAVNDPNMNQLIAERAAYAVTQKGFEPEAMREILATVKRKREDGTAKKPGGLFIHLCRKAGLELAPKREGES